LGHAHAAGDAAAMKITAIRDATVADPRQLGDLIEVLRTQAR